MVGVKHLGDEPSSANCGSETWAQGPREKSLGRIIIVFLFISIRKGMMRRDLFDIMFKVP